jgi:hypothetical protein
MASNFDEVEPMGSCQRCNRQAKYMAIPQPNINMKYKQYFGDMDLVDNSEKNCDITHQV